MHVVGPGHYGRVMILPAVRDPRLVTIRRGGSLTDADHRLLALWAAECAAHVLPLFEAERPDDARPAEPSPRSARGCGASCR